jgi:hypothetical protein
MPSQPHFFSFIKKDTKVHSSKIVKSHAFYKYPHFSIQIQTHRMMGIRLSYPQFVELERAKVITRSQLRIIGKSSELERECTRGYEDYFVECKSATSQTPQQHDTITHHRQQCYDSMRQVWHLRKDLVLLLSHSLLCA